jgi:hypothetical protein
MYILRRVNFPSHTHDEKKAFQRIQSNDVDNNAVYFDCVVAHTAHFHNFLACLAYYSNLRTHRTRTARAKAATTNSVYHGKDSHFSCAHIANVALYSSRYGSGSAFHRTHELVYRQFIPVIRSQHGKKKQKINRFPCNFFWGFPSFVPQNMPRKKKGDDAVQSGNIRQFFQQTTTPLRDITNNETAQNLAAAPRARPSSTRSLKFDQISSGHAAERMQEEDINYSGICRACALFTYAAHAHVNFLHRRGPGRRRRRRERSRS